MSACEWCGGDFDPADSSCTHLTLCPTCAADCGACQREDPYGPDNDDARYDLAREQGRWGG